MLAHLLAADQDITIKELANDLQVSPRTVHRDLKSAEEVLKENGLTLMKKSGVGLRISGSAESKANLELLLIQSDHTDYTPEERLAMILSMLLEAGEPVKLFTIASELFVTVATISHDLDKLEEKLTDFNLHLIRKRGYGVKIEGAEKDKRALLSHLVMEHIDESDFIAMLRENIQKNSRQQTDLISNRLLGLVQPEKLWMIEKRVERMREELPYELADSAYVGLVVHLALAVERLQQGEKIKFDAAYLSELAGTREYKLAAGMTEDLEKVLGMDIPADEVGYITMHLMGAKVRVEHEYLTEDTGTDTAYRAGKLIQAVSSRLDIELASHEKLLYDLTAHLKPTLYRLKQEIKITNPMLEEIRRDYQELFETVEAGVRETFPDIYFPDEEIGFLVLHFAAVLLVENEKTGLHALVICSSGIGTAKLLANQLKQKVPEVIRVDNKSLFEVKDADLSAYELVVSTIPLKGITQNYILASPLLTENEVKQIEKAARRVKINRHTSLKQTQRSSVGSPVKTEEVTARFQRMQRFSGAVLSLLSCFKVEEAAADLSLEQILSEICSRLMEQRLVQNGCQVWQKLLERERLGGMGIPGTALALYHTRSDQVKGPVFLIYPLNEPQLVKGMDGNLMKIKHILLMLAPEDTSQEVLETLSFLSGLVLRSEETVRLFQSADEQAVRTFLAGQLNQFVEEKLSE